MSRRTAPRSRARALVRHSQWSRSEPESLSRAYQLALPVLRLAVGAVASAKAGAVKVRRYFPQTQIGG